MRASYPGLFRGFVLMGGLLATMFPFARRHLLVLTLRSLGWEPQKVFSKAGQGRRFGKSLFRPFDS